MSKEFKEIELWMTELMDTYHSGMIWNDAVRKHCASEKLSFPNLKNPQAIGLVNTNEKCVLCGGLTIGYFAGRSYQEDGIKWSQVRCHECSHEPNLPHYRKCSCKYCKTKREEELIAEQKFLLEKKRISQQEISEHVQKHNEYCKDIEECCIFGSMAILVALLTQSSSENLSVISPLRNSPRKPWPSNLNDPIKKVLEFLKFEAPVPESMQINDSIISFSGMDETFEIISQSKDPKFYLLQALKSASTDCPDAEIIAIDIEELLVAEALDFLEKARLEINLPHVVGEKTLSIIKELVLLRPLGEVFYLIWAACRDGAAALQKDGVYKTYASNLIINKLERLHIRADNNQWKLPTYKRFNYEKQNWLSYVYFNLILNLPGQGIEYSLLQILEIQKMRGWAKKDGLLATHNKKAFEILQNTDPKNIEQ